MAGLIAILLIAVIGLSVGIVLVASSARLGSSMRVQYTAGAQVDCTITANGKLIADKDNTEDEGTIIKIKDGEGNFTKDNAEIIIDATEAETPSFGTIDFDQNITLKAKGYAVYKFEFKNTAEGANPANMNVSLVAKIDEEATTHVGNVKVGVGDTLENAMKSDAGLSQDIANIAASETTARAIYIVLYVQETQYDADATVSVSIAITPVTGNVA